MALPTSVTLLDAAITATQSGFGFEDLIDYDLADDVEVPTGGSNNWGSTGFLSSQYPFAIDNTFSLPWRSRSLKGTNRKSTLEDSINGTFALDELYVSWWIAFNETQAAQPGGSMSASGSNKLIRVWDDLNGNHTRLSWTHKSLAYDAVSGEDGKVATVNIPDWEANKFYRAELYCNTTTGEISVAVLGLLDKFTVNDFAKDDSGGGDAINLTIHQLAALDAQTPEDLNSTFRGWLADIQSNPFQGRVELSNSQAWDGGNIYRILQETTTRTNGSVTFDANYGDLDTEQPIYAHVIGNDGSVEHSELITQESNAVQVNIKLTQTGTIDIPHGKAEGLTFDPVLRNLIRSNDEDGSVVGDTGCFGVYDIDNPTVSIQTKVESDFIGVVGSVETSTSAHSDELEIVFHGPVSNKIYLINNYATVSTPTQEPALFELGHDGSLYEFTNFISLPAKEILNPQCATYASDGMLYVGDYNSAPNTIDIYTMNIDFVNGCTYSDSPVLTINFNVAQMGGGSSGGDSRGYDIAEKDGKLYCIGYQGDGSGGARFKRFVYRVDIATGKIEREYIFSDTGGAGSINRAQAGKPRGITFVDDDMYTVVNPGPPTTNAIGIYTEPDDVIEYDRFIGRDPLEGLNVESSVLLADGESVTTSYAVGFVAGRGESIVCSKARGSSDDGSEQDVFLTLWAAIEYQADRYRPTGPVLYTGNTLTLPERGSASGGIYYGANTVQFAEDYDLEDGQPYIALLSADGGGVYLDAVELSATDLATLDDGSGGTPPATWSSSTMLGMANSFGFGVRNDPLVKPYQTIPYSNRIDAQGATIVSGTIDYSVGLSVGDVIEKVTGLPDGITVSGDNSDPVGDLPDEDVYTTVKVLVRGANGQTNEFIHTWQVGAGGNLVGGGSRKIIPRYYYR